MKKTLLLSFVLFAAFSMSAQVARELVLIEVGTGTGCPYCPGAAMALEDLYANGDPVAGIEYHNYNSGDPFNTPESAARTTYYGISGYPTAQFDGEYDEHVGGSNSSSLYSTYLPKVNARMAIPMEFSTEIYGDNTGSNYDVVVRVTKQSAYSGTNLKVRFALTESDIPYSWQGQSIIDFTERLMAPDENGTGVSFTNIGDQADVNLTFTFNSSWIAANCELIAWIQDDDTKVVLSATKVDLLALVPDVANANFTQSVETTCEGSTVAYTDLSTGAITSWNWIFEGGNPATSTDQNPVVSYASVGSYDVSLEVSDGATSSTMAISDVVTVIVPPVQPDIPVGETVGCASGVYVYTTQAVTNADSYLWKVEPSSAGVITGSGTEGTFTADDSFMGNYTISVRADNFCGTGTFSSGLSCAINFTPAPFMLSDGGGICEGGDGIEITQNGSEANVNYLLYRDGIYTGITVAGTGSAISFGVQSEEGVYSAVGEAAFCDLQMWGTPWIHTITAPGQATQPAGADIVCNDVESNYTTNILDNADSYDWVLSPGEAGEMTANGAEVLIAWSNGFAGEASLEVAGENQCGMGEYSESLTILLSDTPEPVISGPVQTCDFTEEIYTAIENAGNNYDWVVTGGDIVEGAGTHQITVNWTNPGQGSVNLIETTAEDCTGIAVEVLVTIDNCTGIEVNTAGEMSLYPNPVDQRLHVTLDVKTADDAKVYVLNAFGQVVYSQTYSLSTESNTLDINTTSFATGYYLIKVETHGGLTLMQKFVKQ